MDREAEPLTSSVAVRESDKCGWYVEVLVGSEEEAITAPLRRDGLCGWFVAFDGDQAGEPWWDDMCQAVAAWFGALGGTE